MTSSNRCELSAASIEYARIGRPRKDRTFLRGIRLLPPRAVMIARALRFMIESGGPMPRSSALGGGARDHGFDHLEKLGAREPMIVLVRRVAESVGDRLAFRIGVRLEPGRGRPDDV